MILSKKQTNKQTKLNFTLLATFLSLDEDEKKKTQKSQVWQPAQPYSSLITHAVNFPSLPVRSLSCRLLLDNRVSPASLNFCKTTLSHPLNKEHWSPSLPYTCSKLLFHDSFLLVQLLGTKCEVKIILTKSLRPDNS